MGQACARARERSRIMVIGAFNDEVEFLVSNMSVEENHKLSVGRLWVGAWQSRSVFVMKSGVGPDKAETTLREALQLCRPDVILSFGTAGGLSSDCRVGDLVLVDRLIDLRRGESLDINPQLLSTAAMWLCNHQLPFKQGHVVTSPRVIDDEAERDRLCTSFGALAVEMESAVLGQIATAHGIPFLCIRTISDYANSELAVLGPLKATSKTTWREVVAGLIKKPRIALPYWRFRRDLYRSMYRMEKAVGAICLEWH
jgi:adenosylhomocysteine nucleosidase